MRPVAEREIGLMFWGEADPRERLREMKSLGIGCGQMGVRGDMALDCALAWKNALESADFALATVFAAYRGESYTDIATVQRTVGFIPEPARAERERRTMEVSDFAAAIGVMSIACHIGFVPEDRQAPAYAAVRDLVRRVCDHAVRHGQTFALETGQEPAAVLRSFIEDVGRPNLRINFDPANMILYGSGDPVEAVGILAAWIVSVHCKDGEWPASAGALGVEKRLGEGAVDVGRFIGKLKETGYRGPLCIEREAGERARRNTEIGLAAALLRQLLD